MSVQEQRRAQVATVLFLVLMGLAILVLPFSLATGSSSSSGTLQLLATAAALLVAYLLVRTGHVTAGSMVGILTLTVAMLISRWLAEGSDNAPLLLFYLGIPLLLSGLVLRVWAAVMSVTFIMIAGLGLEAGLDPGSGTHEISTLGVCLASIAVLAVVASVIVQQQARTLDEQARVLDENVQLLRQLAENIPEVMFVVSGDGNRMLYTSPAYETVLGRKVEQAMADPRDWLKAVHPEDLPFVLKGLEKNEPNLQYRALHASGEVRHIRARTFPVLGPDGKLARLVGIAEDVTATVQAQEVVRDAQRKRIHLLQQLAHDLASPLSPVKLQLRILRDRLGPDSEKALGIVQRNVDHIQRLVEDVKDVARLESSGLKLDRKFVDLVDLARQAVDTLGPAAAAERQVSVALDAPPSLEVDADGGRITQVLYNLIGNALKFTPINGRIDVELRVEGPTAEVNVRDTGTGMRPDQVSRLFQPFVQVHDGALIKRPEDKGTGLGLYISKGIIEAHGGTIQAFSAGPGRGTTFRFRIPLP